MNDNCLIVAIFTHGYTNGILYGHDDEFEVDLLWKYFTGNRCKYLSGKPKLFFIQACRGTLKDTGSIYKVEKPLACSSMTMKLDSRSFSSAPVEKITIPVMSDILIYFSSAEGFVSYRNRNHGTQFIQILCHQLLNYLNSPKEEDLIAILTRVSRLIAFPKQSPLPLELIESFDSCLQMPTILSMLTKQFIFRKKKIGDVSPIET